MTLQVIVAGDGWVLDKHGKLLADAFGGELRTVPRPALSGGITYLMNYAQVRKLTQTEANYGAVVAMLTHFEPGLARLWERACYYSAALVPMSATTAEHIPHDMRHKCTIIPLPVPDYITQRRPRIGIAGIRSAANEHRKGWDLVDRLRAEHAELDIVTTGGTLTEAEMLAWYRSLDVYLCPSRYEGGPMGVVEAAAMGLPVVAPYSVGWCHGYTTTGFEAGQYGSMVAAINMTLNMVPGVSYPSERDYIEVHRTLFASLGAA